MQKFLKDYVKPYSKQIAIVVIFVIIQVFFQLKILEMTKVIINKGIQNANMDFIIHSGIIMIVLTIFYGLSMVVSSYLSSYISASVTCDVREDLYRKITSFSPLDFKKFGSSTLMTRATADTTRIQIFMINFLRNALLIPIVIIALIIATATINIVLCSVLVVAFAVTMLFMVLKSRQSLELFTKVQEKLDVLNSLLKEKIEGVRSIRAFGKQKFEEKKFAKLNEEYNEKSLTAAYKLYYLTPFALIIMNLSVLVIYYLGAVELEARMINIADLILFSQYVTYFISCLAIVPFIVTTLPKTLVSTERLEEVIYFNETIKNTPSEELVKESSTSNLIEFKNVIFGYDGAKDVIADINLTAKAGTTTAFIGPTGSGKSTITFLLDRLYDPTFGEILYNGVNIKDMDIHELRDKISYCSQKTMVLNDTVYNNIAMNNKELSKEDAMKFSDITLFSEVFDKLPNGLDSIMAQGGMNVSGGQKQRLSLARTIAKDAEIYVFDDCFSALDAKTEKIVRSNIKEYLKGKTVFMVAQKINTILDADNIIVLDKGRIVQQGTHDELLESCTLYQEMYATQSYLTKGEE
ncbi:MAG: ABC transporter ATP-binding protein/permease [Methanobrevibacter woesei]|uniref:ABC transporter ATP-binding protein n=1 Tax=Methanobrevibacter woesei TaxID=190976 RepID=UPI0023F3BE55|nr:ABC transporter ATP-binding protein [Methanobrevibacter woesei]MCI7291010.1 ABC transporter ATP-binding protein/permease [Methanobrevibacter woesei]